MERLTYDFAIGDCHCWQVKGADNLTCNEVCEYQGENGCDGCPLKKAIDRLAAYEDTGLEPEEYKRYADAIKNLDIEHMHDLLQAEKDGRLLVLPCKPGQTIWVESWIRGRVTSIEAPDITWIIKNTERFGKEIFLTRKEADAALKKRKEADNETD